MSEVGNIIKAVLKVDLSECESMDERYIKAIRYLKSYVLDMEFLRNAKTKRRLQCYIESNFNYEDAVKRLNQESDDVSYDALKSTICHVNTLLKNQFGDICGIIKNPDEKNIEDLYNAVRLNMGKVDLSSELSKYVDETYTKKYDLHTCKKELLLVMLLCRPAIDKMVENVDKQKLRYICTLLSYPIKNPSDAKELEDFLKIEKIISRIERCDFTELFESSCKE
ncbi:MAG: hypothetical protein IJ419_14745 [Agathobacter sp.]|nr:hypothetical protein [Agathobacter sp.]